MEDGTSQGTTHDLLLALAGRVDDDLLTWARELVALGEDARAVELLTASLVAAHTVLPVPVHAALVAAVRAARIDLGPAAALLQSRPEDGTEHRFVEPDGHDPVAGALLDIPARPLAGCTVLLARRLTPAGTAPGPLPHPVVLVRVHTPTRPADVLAYQLAAALERAGAPASVEVLAAGGPVSAYHAAALDSAVELRNDAADALPWRPTPVARTTRDDQVVERNGAYAQPVTDRETARVPDPDTDRDAHDTGHDREPGSRHDRGPEAGYDGGYDIEHDESEATAVLRAAPEPPEWSLGPGMERHPLAPDPAPERPADRPQVRFDEPPAPERVLRPRPAAPERPTEEFGAAEPLARRAAPPAPRHPGEEYVPPREPDRPEPDDHEFNDAFDDAGNAVASTGRMQAAPRRTPEPAPDNRGAVTGRLPVDAENVHRLDGRDIHDDPDPYDDADPYEEPRGSWDEGESPEPEDDAVPAAPPSPHPLAAPRPARDEPRQPPRATSAPVAAPTPLPAATTRPRPTLTPISRASLPKPIPLVRRDGPTPVPRPIPVTEPHPAVRPGDEGDRDIEPPVEQRPEPLPARPSGTPETRPERIASSAGDSSSDPLNDPLDHPLLAPLLDPTVHDDPLGLDRREPAAAAEPVPDQDDEWSEEWVTGTWAMAPSALTDHPDERPYERNGHRWDDRGAGDHRPDDHGADDHGADDHGADDQHADDHGAGDHRADDHSAHDDGAGDHRADDHRAGERADPEPDIAAAGGGEPRQQDRSSPPRPARHRYLNEPAAGDDAPYERDPADEDAAFTDASPADGADSDKRHDPADGRREVAIEGGRRSPAGPARENLGLRPESVARLSDADRQLLARLQAELVEGRKPRFGRRTGVGNRAGGTGATTTNGSHRSAPPDLAG